jgi:predicted nucleic acid-binding protein
MTFRAVIDTNVVIAGLRSTSEESPNRELQARWDRGSYVWLHSRDILSEYAEKLLELGIPPERIQPFLARLIVAGENVFIAFLLCATNGNATHLVTYDAHLTTLDGLFEFQILGPRKFLEALDKSAETTPDVPENE